MPPRAPPAAAAPHPAAPLLPRQGRPAAPRWRPLWSACARTRRRAQQRWRRGRRSSRRRAWFSRSSPGGWGGRMGMGTRRRKPSSYCMLHKMPAVPLSCTLALCSCPHALPPFINTPQLPGHCGAGAGQRGVPHRAPGRQDARQAAQRGAARLCLRWAALAWCVLVRLCSCIHSGVWLAGSGACPPGSSTPSPAAPMPLPACPQTGAASSPTVLLVSLKAGGVGLNLVAASRVHLLDPWW